jgi:flagellar hook-associated protein 2
MGTITSGVGLISGLPTADIINELLAVDEAPAQIVQAQLNENSAQQSAYTAINTALTSLSNDASTFTSATNFQATTATSSDPTTLTATSTNGAAVGNYQFQVARLVSTQQDVSTGFADPNTSPVGAGTMTFMLGGGQLTSENDLETLNGGQGIVAGDFRITDGAGNTSVINTTGDITLSDIVQQINTDTSIDVNASIEDGSLVLTDKSGKGGGLEVQNVGQSQTASELGIVGSNVAGSIQGSNLVYLSDNTALSQVNDGRGIRLGSGGADINITAADGTTFGVSLASAHTIGDVITAINNASGGKVTASIASGSRGITLTDNTGGGGTLSVADANGSHAAEDLGLTASASGGVITGNALLAGLGTVLLSSLNGGQGLGSLGTMQFSTANGSHFTADVTGATSVQDIIDAINNSSGGAVTAALNPSSTGIQITDNTTGNGTLDISDASGSTASELGIAGNQAAGVTTVSGSNLQRQYVTQNTLLSNLNGGQGVAAGSIQITDASGASATVDLSKATTLGDVIADINSRGIGVTASIDASGSGLLLTNTATGTGKLTVAEDGSTTASDLNILGSAAGSTIDGSYTKTLTVTSNDTLQTLETKINALNAGVTASIIDDGSGGTPYRLSLTSNNSGTAGAVAVDGGTTNLDLTNLVQAQDAAVFVGGTGNSQPLLVTSSKNQITNVINGVTVNLVGTSATPVDLSVSNTSTNVSTALQQFTTDFNTLVDQIATDTAWNTTTNTGGILLGDATVDEVQETLYQAINSQLATSSGPYNSLADMGITVSDDQGHLSFDADTFNAAYAANPQAVQNLFTQTTTGLGNVITNSLKSLTDPVDGLVSIQNQTLQTEATDYQSQLTQLDALVAQKRSQLENQFANLETTLASLDSQGSALSTIGKAASSSTSDLSSIGSGSAAPSDASSATDSSDASDSSDSSDDSSDSTSS